MNGSELAAARARLGLTADKFAAELGLPPHAYASLEAGRAKIPKREEQLVAFHVACAERDEALAKSGLPTCRWIEQWERESPPADAKLKQRVAYFERAGVHAKTCQACQAREQFVKDHFPNMPTPPVAGWMRVIGAFAKWVEARPEWARPAFYGAAILAALTSIRVVFILLGAVRQPKLLLVALSALVAASAAGAFGGLVYSLIGRPARRVPVVGPYLAGIVAVAGYMGALVPLGVFSGEKDLGVMLIAFGIVAVLFGLVIGHQWFRPRAVESA